MALVAQSAPAMVAVLLVCASTLATAQQTSGWTVFGRVSHQPADYAAILHLADERPLYEQMAMLVSSGQEERLGFGGALIQPGEKDFAVDVPQPGAWWVVVQGSGAGLASPDMAFPLIGPLSNVLLPPFQPKRGSSCRLRLLGPAVAWVAPSRRAGNVDGGAGAFPRWEVWRPWIRLDRAGSDRHYWLDPVADPGSSPQPLGIRIGAPGYAPSSFECSSGALIEVSLEPRPERLLDLRLVIDGAKGDGDALGEALQAAVLVDTAGWPVGVADEAGKVAVARGAYRVLGPSGGEWRIRVEDAGTRRLAVPERSVTVLASADAGEALATTVIAIHRSRAGELLARQTLGPTVMAPGTRHRTTWTVRPPAGAATTTILAPGFEKQTVDWSLDQEDIELTPFRLIEGVVLADETGDPVQGAEVALHGAFTGRLAPVALTASNGGFRIEASEAQSPPRLVVRAEGYRAARVALEPAASRAFAPGPIVVRLERAASIFGRIVSPSGEGVAGLAALVGQQRFFVPPSLGPVDLFLASNPSLHDVTQADEDGVFRFPDVSPAARSVAVGAPGYATRFVPLRSNAGSAALLAEWTGWHDLGQVALAPELAVEGVVTDRARQPLAGAVVGFGRSPDVAGALSLDSVAWATGEIQSDAEGRFRIGGLRHGDLLDLFVQHPGYGRAERLRVSVDRAADPRRVDIAMEPATELRGRLVDEASGKGIEGIRVQLLDQAERRQLALERTGSEGRFFLRGLASLNGVLKVEAFGYAPFRRELTDDDGLYSTGGDGLVLVLRRGDATVRGVVNSGGAPVVGAVVQMNTMERTTTDAAGRFELSGLPMGESMVFCWPPGGESGQPIMWYRDVRPGITELVLDLTPVWVEGWVEDTAGLPVAGATVRISRPLAPDRVARSAPDGSFRLDVTPGLYRASAEVDGYGATSREIEVGTNAPVGIVLRLDGAREIRARVAGLTAEEAVTVEVGIEPTPLSPGGGGRLKRSPNQLGGAPVFVQHNPPIGTVVLVARVRSSDRMQRRTVDVLPRGVTEVEIAFDNAETNGRLSGLVTVDGSPLAGAPVFVIDERAGDAWAVRTDHRGMYVIDGLRRGRVEIAAVGERRTLSVDGESVADFRARSAVLAGRIVVADAGEPAAGLEVLAIPAHAPLEIAERMGQTAVVRSAEDGSFSISGLFQVSYRVVARRRGGRVVGSAVVDLTVWTGETLIAVRDAEPLE